MADCSSEFIIVLFFIKYSFFLDFDYSFILPSNTAMNPCPQQNIEHYQVLSLLGDGGQAKYQIYLFRVYLCSDNDRLVAIKVYDQGYSKKEAFKKEVEFMSLFDCSNLLSMIGSKVDGLVRLEGVEECTRPIVVLELAQRG